MPAPIRPFLASLDHDALVDLIVEEADRDNGLAERLFRWELSDDWDVFRGAAETYSDVLGEAGLASYRLQAEAEWERMPTLAPVPDGREPHDPERFSITYMMESLAHAYHDVDMEIAVRTRDLSSAYRFLEIAQVCQNAGRSDEALHWAERGFAAFPDRTDQRLRAFLADEYLRRARADDAMAVIWAQFLEQPALAAFQLLKRYADQIETWTLWRSRALGEVRRSIDLAKTAGPTSAPIGRARYRWDLPPDGTRLVDILLWEGHVDEAWTEAQALRCSPGLLLQLAAVRQATHPNDAIPIYRQEVERLLKVSDKRNYAQAVELLGRIGPLMSRQGRATEFESYVADIRAANARRPAFTSVLDAAQLAPKRPLLRALD